MLTINSGNGINSSTSSVTLVSGQGYSITDLGVSIGQHLVITVGSESIQAIVITGSQARGLRNDYVVFSILTSDLNKFTATKGTVNGKTLSFQFMGTETSSFDAYQAGIKSAAIANSQVYYLDDSYYFM